MPPRPRNDKSGRLCGNVMDRVAAMQHLMPFLVGLVIWLAAAEKPPVLLRVHLQAPEGAKGTATVPLRLPNPPETIAVRSLPEVTEKDVRGVLLLPDNTIQVEFDSFGQTKLEVATSTGRGLILVVIANGRVVYAPIIDTVLSRGILLLPGGSLSDDEIRSLNQEKERDRSQKLKSVSARASDS